MKHFWSNIVMKHFWLGIALIFLIPVVYYVGMVSIDKAIQLENRVTELEENIYGEITEDVGAGGSLVWRNCLTGGGECLDGVTGYTDGDGAIIIQDDGGVYKAYFLRYDSAPTGSPAENSPDVVAPDDIGANPGRWMLIEFYVRVLVVSPSSTAPGQITIYEDTDNGSNYYILNVPSAITSNETFTVGRWRIEAKTLVGANFDIEVDETHTTFVCTIAGLTADRSGNLPSATGSGVIHGFYIKDGDGTFDLRVEPDGTDTIGAGAAGHYWEAKAIGSYILVQDVASGKWSMLTQLTWTEET